MNGLLTSVGRRNYLVDYFREALGREGQVFVADANPFAPAAREADRAFTVPLVKHPDYFDALLDICRRNDVGLLLSLNDLELPRLARQRDRFERAGIHVVISRPEVIDICADKLATAEFLQSQGLPVPRAYVGLKELHQALEAGEISFPLVIKARWGSGSIGLGFVESQLDLEET